MPLSNSSKKADESAGRHLLLLGTIAIVFLLDRLTKDWALASLPFQQSVDVLGSLIRLTLTFNTGAAFSILSGKNTWLIFLSIIVIGAVLYSYTRIGESLQKSFAIGLILGGAFGNLIDRFNTGAIIDFIDISIIPIFNFADSAISLGVALLLFIFWKEDRKSSKK